MNTMGERGDGEGEGTRKKHLELSKLFVLAACKKGVER